MTTTSIPTTQELQDQFIAVVRKGQEIALDAIKATAEAVASVTSKVPSVSIPLADKVPAPETVVASAYDFAATLLTEQRKFAEEALKAAAPLWPAAAEAKPATAPEDAQ